MKRESLRAYAEKEKNRYENLLESFVNIPSVSVDPTHSMDIEAIASLAAQTIHDLGGEAHIYRSDSAYPLIHGIFHQGNNYPTVTVYNHLDVQPAEKEAEGWRTDPFIFTKDNDRYWARGTTDDKGPALTALLGARAAVDAGVQANIHFLWETEEEIGSPNFEKLVQKAGKALATNSVVVSDTMWLSRTRPTITSGLRGFQTIRLELETGVSDQHSGDTGGAARNPIGELMKVVCEIYDPQTGYVRVPGFYDDVVRPTKKELEDFRRSGVTANQFKKTYQFKSLRTNDSLEIMKRIWAMPTFEVHGVTGGYTGPGIKAIVPPRAEVKASCRLVPDQKPAKISRLIKDFVKKKNPDVKVHAEAGGVALKGTTSGPFADAVKRSIRFAFGKDPAFVREGGSIGSIVTIQKHLKCPVMFLGLSLPEHGYHAPNENFDWQQASGGIAAFAQYFEEIAHLR